MFLFISIGESFLALDMETKFSWSDEFRNENKKQKNNKNLPSVENYKTSLFHSYCCKKKISWVLFKSDFLCSFSFSFVLSALHSFSSPFYAIITHTLSCCSNQHKKWNATQNVHSNLSRIFFLFSFPSISFPFWISYHFSC